MKSTTFLAILLNASITLAHPIHSFPHTQPEAIYSMKSFTTIKYDDKNINTVSFDIISADSGTVDFTCSAYDPELGHVTESFESGKIYSCGGNLDFSFSYSPGRSETVDDLVLWQKVDGKETWRGSTTPAGEVCRPGGDGDRSLVCVAPDQEDAYVEMRKS